MKIRKYIADLYNYLAMLGRKHSYNSGWLELKLASFFFSRKLGDYYVFLADVMESTQGKKSLLSVFQTDVARYGNTARGKLSKHWAKQFSEGGSLGRTFYGTLPDEDVAMISTLQTKGDEHALKSGLRELAQTKALISKARSMILITMAAALLGLIVVIISIMILPFIIVPQLIDNFSMIPRDQYPEIAESLVNFSDFIGSYWVVLTVVFVVLIIFCNWSLSSVTGRFRLKLDKYGIAWGVYRDFQSMRFMSSLASMVRKGGAAKGLREAIELQMSGASRWKRYHLNKMIALIDTGNVGPDIFCTGMLSKEMEYTMSDLIESRGIEGSLTFVKDRLEERSLAKLNIQANILSWVLMIGCLIISTYLMVWQLAAMDALIEALKIQITS